SEYLEYFNEEYRDLLKRILIGLLFLSFLQCSTFITYAIARGCMLTLKDNLVMNGVFLLWRSSFFRCS
ncbi:hypothetical protein PMAYCL1PPCAC_00458, partial [Pristionchus mayeri]